MRFRVPATGPAPHLSADALEALLDPVAPAPALPSHATRPRPADPAVVTAHLAECPSCRAALDETRRVVHAARALPTPPLPAELRARVLASRAAGVRPLVPPVPVPLAAAEDEADDRGPTLRSDPATAPSARAPQARAGDPVGGRTRWRSRRWVAAVAAALGAVVAGSLLAPNEDVQAGTTRGRLVLSPALPRPGQAVVVHYHPAALLSTQPWLALRARLRRPGDGSYNRGRPVTTVARLVRQADGSYAGRFALPDSAVYAALAVEDSAAATVDDDGGRAWEVLAAAATDRPTFAALDQRANDLMGRNWEEGFATVRRMVALYPDTLAGWSWLRAHQGWLNRGDDDTVRTLHRAQLARFDARFSGTPAPPAEAIGLMAWYADGIDSLVARRWRARLLRDAPTNEFAVQWRLLDELGTLRAAHDTARALARLDALWAEAPSSRREQVAMYAGAVAWDAHDTARAQTWGDRQVAAADNRAAAARGLAVRFARDARLRPEGVRRLRAELTRLERLDPAERALDETAKEQRARQDAARRRVLAALGQALVADRAYRAGLDTLTLAAAAGWDVEVFRSVRAAGLAAGDTTLALTMAARVAADPRTPAAYADSVRPAAERALGAAAWAERRAVARREFVERMLADAPTRALAGPVRLTDATGRAHDLAALAAGQVTVVAFTSRSCGPAIEDLPRLAAVRGRLERAGVRVLLVVGEPGPSPALTAFLTKGGVTGPVYFDARREASRALNQWGTPNYYVLDGDGRARFEVTSSSEELLARAEALRAAEAN